MFVVHHILITIVVWIFGIFFFDFSITQFLLFLLGGVFLDADHIFSYWYYRKEYSLNYKKIKNWCIEVGYRMDHFFIFHSVWFLLVLWFLQQEYDVLTMLFYGVVLHVILDIFVDFYWCVFLKKNLRPYRRWIAPKSWLEKLGLDKLF